MSTMEVLAPETRRKLMLSVGTHRRERPLSPVEVAEAIEAMVSAGAKPKEVAEALHLEDITMITRFRRLLRLDPNVQHVIGWGNSGATISLTVAAEIARLHAGPDQEALVRAVIEHRLGRNEIRQVVQVRDRTARSVGQIIEEVLERRPQVTRTYLFIGAVPPGELQEAIRTMTQQQRDGLLAAVLPQLYMAKQGASGRLGAERYTLVGDEGFAKAMQQTPGGFEEAINVLLAREIRSR